MSDIHLNQLGEPLQWSLQSDLMAQNKPQQEQKAVSNTVQAMTLDLLKGRMTTCQCRFPNQLDTDSKTYTFKLPAELDCKVGDIVLVEARADSKSGFPRAVKIAWIDEFPVLDLTNQIELAWVISKMDTAAFEAIKALESKIEASIKNRMSSLQASRMFAEYGLDREQLFREITGNTGAL